MAWSSEERKGFIESSNNNVGQIAREHDIGKIIYNYATDNKFVNFLEIGTWKWVRFNKMFH